MGVPELAAVVATVLAATGVLPQCARLVRTRDCEGVSLTGAVLGVATETAWVAFMIEHHIWSALTMPALMVIANATLVLCIVRAGCDAGASVRVGAGWALVLVGVALLGGWVTLGIVLGFSYAVQITPTIADAYRSEIPTGIAPARWVMVMCETSLWMFYGAARNEPSIFIFGVVAGSSAAAILARWITTRSRVASVHAGPHESSERVRSLPTTSSVSRLRNAS